MVASPVTIPIKQLQLAPGSLATLSDVTWDAYEAILTELGAERRVPRITYSNGILELMSPLPRHERPHKLIGYIVTTLLDAAEQDWEDFGSTTFKRPDKQAGLEPDTCFYIQNAAQVRDCQRMDLSTYPPPDLAIESDVTSKTTLEAYQRIGIPELWIYAAGTLTIYRLNQDEYVQSETSPLFPDYAIPALIPQLIEEAFAVGSSQMLRNLRSRLTQGQL